MMINQLLKFPISGSKETRCGSGLRRMLCLAALLVFCVAEAWSAGEAFSYDLWVGGVKVNSSNASNITGDNIRPYDSSVNSGKPKVYYESGSNTLYLYNAYILRTGNDHHAIESNVPGLKIVLQGDNRLKAYDASAVRLNANTTITTKWSSYGNCDIQFQGVSEDVVYAGKDKNGNSPMITIEDAYLQLSSESSAFDAVTGGDSKLIIKNSYITAECTKDKSDDCYALFDYKSLTIEKSTVKLTGYSQAIKNLTELTLGPGMYIETPSGGIFYSSYKTVRDRYGNTAKTVLFKMTEIEINSTTFPDEKYRNCVLGLTCGEDGYLTPPEIARETSQYIYNKGIANLKGIEYFTALHELKCYGNQLTTLDLSNNKALKELHCQANKLTALDLSKNTALIYLHCNDNQLTTLDLSKNTALIELYCFNNQLTSLKLNSNMEVEKVYCYGNKLRGSSVTTLINSLPSTSTGGTLYFYKNETSTGNSMTLAQVKAAKAKKWNVLMYDGKDWVDYVGSDVIAVINETNFPDEEFRNWVLAQDYGKDGYLTDDEIASVKEINVYNKNIVSLKGIEFFTALINLNCYNNQLTTLDVSKNTALIYLYCSGNQLTTLDVSKNTALKKLYCDYNNLTTLDVSKNTELTYLYCEYNNLTTLDVSKNTALKELYCHNNQLTTLDVSKNTALIYLHCGGNQLTTLDVSKNTALIELYCDNNQLTTLDVSKYTALTNLACSNNQLTTLDVSKNTALIYLYCSGNQLTTLDVSKNTALKKLYCDYNNLTTLDVSKNTELTYLHCVSNNLTTLDVSKNTALRRLDCYNNGIRGEGMTTLVNSLPVIPEGEVGELYVCNDETPAGNEMTAKQVAVAKEKGWQCIDYNSMDDYEGLPDGDVNTDGSVDNKDVEDLSDFIMGRLPEADKWFFDANGDGEVNAADIVYVINILNK